MLGRGAQQRGDGGGEKKGRNMTICHGLIVVLCLLPAPTVAHTKWQTCASPLAHARTHTHPHTHTLTHHTHVDCMHICTCTHPTATRTHSHTRKPMMAHMRTLIHTTHWHTHPPIHPPWRGPSDKLALQHWHPRRKLQCRNVQCFCVSVRSVCL